LAGSRFITKPMMAVFIGWAGKVWKEKVQDSWLFSCYFFIAWQKIPMQLHSKQYCFKTLNPQQSPPSNLHGTLLLISSQDPSDIHSSNPPAVTVTRGLGKLQYRQIWI
jgi:hypothetical protein